MATGNMPEGLGWIPAGGPNASSGLQDFELIMRGPHSTVYRAKQSLAGGIIRAVAVKILNGDRHERMRRELELTVELGAHPNIITVYDIGKTVDGSPYIVMEHCPLGSLAASREARPVDQVLAAGIAVADALTFAHGRGVIHRDIKPDNILARRDEPQPSSYVLTDFGIARPIDAAITGSINTCTYLYASPQHFQAQPPAFTDDIWSLGATLFTLLDGDPPFTNLDQHDNQSAYQVRVMRGAPRPLHRQDVPDMLRQIITRCMHKDPADRYAHAAELRDALITVGLDFARTSSSASLRNEQPALATPTTDTGESIQLNHEPVAASALAHVRPAADPATGPTASAKSPAPLPESRPRSRRWVAASSIVAALLILTPVGIFIARHEGEPRTAGRGSTSQTETSHAQQLSVSPPPPSSAAVSQPAQPTTTPRTSPPPPSSSPANQPPSSTQRAYPPEPAPNVASYNELASTYSGRCLGVTGLYEGALIMQYQSSWLEGCTRYDPVFRWGWGGGYYGNSFKIVNQKSGMCLDIASDAAGSDVVQKTCRDSNGSQLWNWYDQGSYNGWNQGLICNIRTSWCVFLRGQSRAEGDTLNQEPLEPYRSGHQFRVPAPHNPA